MHNWQETEISELLALRGSETIRGQFTGTTKDSVVYQRMSKLLAERGVHRSPMQIINKLKALRKQYLKYHQQKTRCGSVRVHWTFYEQCHRAFENVSPVNRPRSPTPPPVASPPPARSEDGRDVNEHLGPVEAEDDEGSPPDQLHSFNTSK